MGLSGILTTIEDSDGDEIEADSCNDDDDDDDGAHGDDNGE